MWSKEAARQWPRDLTRNQHVGRGTCHRAQFDGEPGQRRRNGLIFALQMGGQIGKGPTDADWRKLIGIAHQNQPLHMREVQCHQNRK